MSSPLADRTGDNLSTQPPVPDWICQFSYPAWTNVFQLVPNTKNLYPDALRPDWKPQFNDWNGRILLLAKDGCPTRVTREGFENGESQPWRYGQKELGDEGGWRTNNRLYRFASIIPGGKLYGSSTANMLYDDPGWSRYLPGFFAGPLHEFLKRVLSWVLESMPRVEWVACLGNEAWFLTCIALGHPSAAARFKEYRNACRPVVGNVGSKRITAFPLYHPAALGNAINRMESGWQAFAAALSVPANAEIDEKLSPTASEALSTGNTTRQRTLAALRNFDTKESVPKLRRGVTATLSRRHCRVQFMIGPKPIHISPQYDSGNTWSKIIAYARSKRGGAPANLPTAAVAIPQVLTSAGWIDVNE